MDSFLKLLILQMNVRSVTRAENGINFSNFVLFAVLRFKIENLSAESYRHLLKLRM